MSIPAVLKLLKQIEQIHSSKNKDYTTGAWNENFLRSAELISWFENDRDKAFVALIATKLARLGSLLQEGKEAKHESIEDTFLDLSTYCVLWASDYKERK